MRSGRIGKSQLCLYKLRALQHTLNCLCSNRKQVETVPLDGIMPESPTKIRTPLTGSRVPLGIAAIPENCPPGKL